MAWVNCFIRNLTKDVNQRVKGELNQTEIEAATKVLIRLVQAKEKGQLARSNNIFNLMPYMDEENLIRLYGRADAANEIHLTN